MAQWFERYRSILFFALIVAVIISLALFEGRRPEPVPLVLPSSPPPTRVEPTPTLTPSPLRVYVSGAVHQPDVYLLPPGSIVKDVISAAGGPVAEADLDRINLAQPVADGEHVYVPHIGEQNLPVQLPSGQPSPAGKVNINTADQTALESLPGIGPELAQRILDYRQAHGAFAQIEDLLNVSGIGPTILEKIREQITTD